MGNLQGFNAEKVEPQGSFDPIPAGWYTCMITDSEMKPTKSGAGEYLQLRLDVIDGEHENRVIFDRLNLVNDNQTAVDIAQRTLSSICHAIGVLEPQDSSDLHDKPMRVKVSVRPAGNGYDASNEVKGYAAVEGAGTAASPAKPKKPWE